MVGRRRGFNPLPPPKQGEMFCDPPEPHTLLWFQSAPPAEARGDRCSSLPFVLMPSFNPLPPPKQGEMAKAPANTSTISKFQSAPPAEARGDSGGRRRQSSICCFNPLPPPKQGEMLKTRSLRRSRSSFNPLPPPKQGEMPTAVTEGTPMGYAGGCAMRPNDCHEFPIRLSINAITRYRAVTCRLREYAAKTPLLGFRACYKISGASKFTGSSIP